MVVTVSVKKAKKIEIPARTEGKNENASWSARDAGHSYRVLGEINGRYTLIFDLPFNSEEPEIGEIQDYEVGGYETLSDILNGPIKVKNVQEVF